jgi:myo-inositol-1(or 4)-monophosphatase
MDPLQLTQLLNKVIDLSKEVGAYLISQRVSAADVELKEFNNLVSYVDKEAERRFVEGLMVILPKAGFIAEEGTGQRSDDYNWIIDPLDGTTNFIHGIPVFCTSVALERKGEILLGVIFDPNHKECFAAAKNQGASLNGKAIHVSKSKELSHSLIATGFPYYDFGKQDAYLNLLKAMMQETRGVRRLGSAAIDLAYVACGRCEAFYEYALHPWDIAAGIIIVEEAGGKVTGFPGSDDPLFGKDIIASNTQIHGALEAQVLLYFNEI